MGSRVKTPAYSRDRVLPSSVNDCTCLKEAPRAGSVPVPPLKWNALIKLGDCYHVVRYKPSQRARPARVREQLAAR